MELISVIIAVRNDAEHIGECLRLLLKQDYSEYEIIVVDGKSADNTQTVVKNFIKTNPKIRLLTNPHKDAANGRNIGIKDSKSEIIAFIDSDAYPTDNYWLAKIHKRIKENKDPMIAGIGGPDTAVLKKSNMGKAIAKALYSPLASGGFFNPSSQHKKIKRALKVKHIPTCNLALKKNIFEKEGFFDPNFIKGQDLEFSTRLAKKGYRFVFYPEIKVKHYKKSNLKSFRRQVYKMGTAKAIVLKKHKTNFAYTIPLIYAITLFMLAGLLLLGFKTLPLMVFLLGIYFIGIILESLRVARPNCKIFLMLIFIFPVIHFFYTLGFSKGIIQKKTSRRLFDK